MSALLNSVNRTASLLSFDHLVGAGASLARGVGNTARSLAHPVMRPSGHGHSPMAKLSRLVVIARAASHAWLGKGRAGR